MEEDVLITYTYLLLTLTSSLQSPIEMFTFSAFKIPFLGSCKPLLGDRHHGPQFISIPTTKKSIAPIICKRTDKQKAFMKGKFGCNECDKKFDLPLQLKEHVEKAHPNPGVSLCPKCGNQKPLGEKYVCVVEDGEVE